MKAIRYARGLNKGLFWFILLALLLALALPIGNAGVAQAQPGAVTVTDFFEDETRIASKENVAVDTTAGQAKLGPVLSATYGGTSDDFFRAVYADGDYIYAAGETWSGEQESSDALLVKFTSSLPSGSYTDCGFTFQDSGLTLADSGLTLADSGLALADSGLTLNDSGLTLADSALTLEVCPIYISPAGGVGGETYPVNKLAILASWIALAALLAGGIGWFMLRRRKVQM